MQLPEAVPVMTLPDGILFPQALMPLRIYEPKYRAMLKDALEGDRIFAVALARRAGPSKRPSAPCQVASVGLIRVCVDNPDGTSILILQGLARVHLLAFIQTRPYRVAEIDPICSTHADDEEVPRLMERVAEIAIKRTFDTPHIPPQVSQLLAELKDPDLLCDLIGYTMVDDIRQKQHLLEMADVRQRLRALIPMLDHGE